MKSFFLSLLFSILSVVMFAQKNSTSINEPENVSLIRLIANPDKYHGKKVQVVGFLHLEFEGDAIYSHEEDYKRSLMQNSFWVDFSPSLLKEKDPKKLSGKYVIIVGTFNARHKGHMDIFGGTFENIVRLDLWQ
jgi:hypothetical protein